MRLTGHQRLMRLKRDLDYVGHSAYSRDNFNSPTAIRAFEKLEAMKAEIARLQKTNGFSAHGIVQMPTERDGDGWTVSESIAGTCVSFPTKREAREWCRFFSEYVERWGFVNLASAPLGLDDQPVMFTEAETVVEDLASIYAQLRKRGVPNVPADPVVGPLVGA